jgi:LEA14-like dessication related protein
MGSCFSKVGFIIPPEVSVTNITFSSTGPSGVSTDVTLAVMNPNPGTVETSSFTYQVHKKSDNTLLTEGNGKSFVALGNRKRTEVVIPAKFPITGIGAAEKSLLFRGETTVVFSATLVFDAPLAKEGKVTVPFSGGACRFG